MKGGSGEGNMSLLDHLEELRWRIVKSFFSLLLAACGVYFFWREIFEVILVYPLRSIQPPPKLIFTTPSEAFMTSIKIALFGGVFISCPYILYQIWRFVAPGLYRRERRFALSMIVLSVFCFIGGIVFSFVAIPQAIDFLAQFQTPTLSAYFMLNSYLNFIIRIALAFGLVFQMPVCALVFTRMGIITHRSLLHYWRFALVIIFIMAALLTPPDVVSQLIMSGPLVALYVISIGIAWLAQRKRARA